MAHEGGEHSGGGAIRELLAVFGFGVETEELEHAESKLEEFGKKIKEIGEGILAALAIEEVYEWAESNVKAMSEVEHAASRLGVSTEEVQQYQYASQALGFESEKLINAMSRLQVVQQAAAGGSKQASAAFSGLGISVKDSNGHMKEADQLFMEIADKIADTDDASKKAAYATTLFGRSGRELLPVLNEGADGLDELLEEYKKIGGGYSEEAIEKSKEFEHQSARLSLSFKGLKSTIMSALLPPLTWVIEKISAGAGWFKQITEDSRVFQVALYALGAAALAFAAPMLIAAAPVLALAAALGLVVLLVDDIVGMFEGKDSLIGTAIDKLFGKDAHLDVVRSLKEAWAAVKEQIKTSWDFLKGLYETLKPVAETMGNVMASMLSIGDKFNHFRNKATGTGDETEEERVRRRILTRVMDTVREGKPLSEAGLSAPELKYAQLALGSSGGGGGAVEHNVNVKVEADPSVIVKHVKEERKAAHRDAANTFQRGSAE